MAVPLAWVTVAGAAESSAEPLSLTEEPCITRAERARETSSFSLAGGFGVGLPIGPARDSDLEDVRFISLFPSWSRGLSDCLASRSWYRGAVRAAVEGSFLASLEPHHGFAGGMTFLLQYEFLRRSRVVPFVTTGLGFVFMDFDLDRQHDGFSFTPQLGLGLRFRWSERTDVVAEWRFHHISNAGLRDPNTGLDSSLFFLGVSYPLGG